MELGSKKREVMLHKCMLFLDFKNVEFWIFSNLCGSPTEKIRKKT